MHYTFHSSDQLVLYIHTNKIIKVDSDELDDAINKAKDTFEKLKLSGVYQNENDFIFEEVNIEKVGKQLANMYNARVDKSAGLDDVMWIVDMICDDPDLVDYIQEETIKSLEDDYNIILNDIQI